MDERKEMTPEEPAYVPRPAWQVWAARVAAVLFVIIIIAQLVGIARGGL